MIPSWATKKALPFIDSYKNDIKGKAFCFLSFHGHFLLKKLPVSSSDTQ